MLDSWVQQSRFFLPGAVTPESRPQRGRLQSTFRLLLVVNSDVLEFFSFWSSPGQVDGAAFAIG